MLVQIDTFLEEIKGRVDTGSSHQMYTGQTPSSGSMDDGDPSSTNLYLGNLAPTITEEALQVKVFIHPLVFWRDWDAFFLRFVVSFRVCV